jgi:peptidoglycan/xylan/chitin deacetylase (PgdA/CDA1 family)
MNTTRTYLVSRALGLLAISIVSLVVTVAAAPAATSSEGATTRSSALARPEKRLDRSQRTEGVPILMYHVIADPRADVPYPELFVRPSDFRSQMRWLERHGYHPVTLRAVWDHWFRGAPLPRKPIVLSFDDGYRSVAHVALPAMRERRWPGVLNLTVKNLHVRGGLSERQVRRLVAARWELAAHTITHPDLTTLGHRELAREVAGSRRQLRAQFHVPVDFFCYPSGRYNARVIAAVRSAGYLGATTTVEGLAEPGKPYELRRVRVSRSDGVAGVAAQLRHLTQNR